MHKNPHPKIEIKSNSMRSTIVARQSIDEHTSKIDWKQGMIINSLF